MSFSCIETQLNFILNIGSCKFLNSFICSNCFGGILRVFCTQYDVIFKQRQFYFFLYDLDAFISISLLIACQNLQHYVYGSDESGHPCMFLTSEESFQHFSVEYDINCGFVIYDLYYFEITFLYTQFIESCYHERLLNFVIYIFLSTEMFIWYLSFILVYSCTDIEPSMHHISV